jgi:hypothetical protein
MRILAKGIIGVLSAAALTTGAITAFAGGNSPDPTPRPTSTIDVKGPCDEAEHANDPRCAGQQTPEDNQAGNDDGANHDVNDDNGGISGNDDGANHDVNDDNGGISGNDDGANHDVNDDNGGISGNDDGANHDVNDDDGGMSGNSGSGSSGEDRSGSGSEEDNSGSGSSHDDSGPGSSGAGGGNA